jgi:1-acyl-sn-glycerol-3-phosphate acyltransferase
MTASQYAVMFSFDHDAKPSWTQLILALFVIPLRVLFVTAAFPPFAATCLVCPWLSDAVLDVILRYSLHLLLLSLGVVLTVKDGGAFLGVGGRPQLSASLPRVLISSHTNGHMDALVLLAVFGARYGFVANAPVFRLPLMGRLLTRLGSVRVEPGARSGASGRLHAALARGGRLAVFAEGGCTNGRAAVLRFRTGAFLPPLLPVLPVAITYPRTWGASLAARGEVLDGPRRPFWAYLLLLFGWPAHAAQVTIALPVEPASADETPTGFACRVQRSVAAAAGLAPSLLAYSDFRSLAHPLGPADN